MDLVKSFIVDDQGKIESVVLDYREFKKIEAMILDFGLAKAMDEAVEDEEMDLEEARLEIQLSE
ncbi:MAG: antitoxin [Candidatus Marinimicrobia bacterium]|nr:antitoxin [Candidatus Neomarinimicrobiota bacterium]